MLEPAAMPLNRVGKIDYVRLAEVARSEAEASAIGRQPKADPAGVHGGYAQFESVSGCRQL